MIDWLNDNNGTLIVITIFLLALITGWYIHSTRQLLKALCKPEIVVYLRAAEVSKYRSRVPAYMVQCCVKNVGAGVARKIRFGGDLVVKNDLFINGSLLKSVSFIEDGIDTLVQGDERTCQAGYEEQGESRELRLTVTAVYQDSMGNSFEGKFPLNFRDPTLPQIPQ